MVVGGLLEGVRMGVRLGSHALVLDSLL